MWSSEGNIPQKNAQSADAASVRGKTGDADRMRPRLPAWEGARRGGVLLLIVSVLANVALGLALVWLNNERTRLALRAHALQRDVDARMELNAKLEVEHNHLLSPELLSKRAASLGLRAALPGEIRRMEAPESGTGEK